MNTRTNLAALLAFITLPAALAAAPSAVAVSTATRKAVQATAAKQNAKPAADKPASGTTGTKISAKTAETLKVSTETAKSKTPAPVQVSTAAAKAAPKAQETARGPAHPPAPKGAVPPPPKPGEPPPPPPPDTKPQPEKPAPLTSEDVFPSGLRDPFHAGATMGTTTVNIARKDRPDITDLNPDAVTLVGFSISRVGRFAVLKDTKKNARFYLRGGKFYSEKGTLIKGMSGIVQDGRVTILAGRTVKDLYIEPKNKPGAKSKTGGDDTSAK